MTIIDVKWSIRQNPWKVHTKTFDTLEQTKVILCSGYHEASRCRIDDEGKLILDPTNKKGNKFIEAIKIGDYAIVFENGNRNEAMIVKIMSEPYKKTIPEITIYRKYDFQNFYRGDEVEVCLTGKNTKDFTHSEIMTAFVRDIEIVKRIDRDERIFNKYWQFQSSIQQNCAIERYMSV
jgi:hypothetical protein